MKARRLLYWLGLFCMAVLVLMPDITVNAQPVPDEQDSSGPIPNEVEGEGPDTQAPPEEETLEEPLPPEQQQPPGEQGPSSQEPTQPMGGRMRVAEQSLIEIGCQYTSSGTNPGDGSVWKSYQCPPGNKFDTGPPISTIVGYQPWVCLVSPDRVPSYGEEDIRSGECVPPIGGGGAAIREPAGENDQSPREVNVTQIRKPAASDSQGEGDQQQANGDDVAQADEEEAGGEENNASDQSQENNSSKQGYGCSA
jgi:hypothetical protein